MNPYHETQREAGPQAAASPSRHWRNLEPETVYTELLHPADLFFEIHGRSFSELCEHALYALFHNLAELDSVMPRSTQTLQASASAPAEALRRLVAEALVLFDAEHFLAAGCQVDVSNTAPLTLTAVLWGEMFDPRRHELLSEIKAVTRHQLAADQEKTGRWRATILLDV